MPCCAKGVQVVLAMGTEPFFKMAETARGTVNPPSSSTRTVMRLAAATRKLRSVSVSPAQTAHRAMGSFTYPYPRPAVTVDTIIVAQPQDAASEAQLLLIKRLNPPFKDCWALPGGFVDEGEGLDAAAARELQEETSVDPSSVVLSQVGAFGDPGRDPRGWTVTVAYAALVPSTDIGVKAADDAKDAQWFPISSLPALAFDHKLVVRSSLRHLSGREPAKTSGLTDALLAAAEKLEGPWKTE